MARSDLEVSLLGLLLWWHCVHTAECASKLPNPLIFTGGCWWSVNLIRSTWLLLGLLIPMGLLSFLQAYIDLGNLKLHCGSRLVKNQRTANSRFDISYFSEHRENLFSENKLVWNCKIHPYTFWLFFKCLVKSDTLNETKTFVNCWIDGGHKIWQNAGDVDRLLRQPQGEGGFSWGHIQRQHFKTYLLLLKSWMKFYFCKCAVDHFVPGSQSLANSSFTSIRFLTSLPMFSDSCRLCRMSCWFNHP